MVETRNLNLPALRMLKLLFTYFSAPDHLMRVDSQGALRDPKIVRQIEELIKPVSSSLYPFISSVLSVVWCVRMWRLVIDIRPYKDYLSGESDDSAL